MSDSSEDYFDAVGAGWDGLREAFFSTRVRDAALDAAKLEAGCLAADVGAGTGFLAEGLLERGLRVIAVDRSAKMLEALRHKFPFPERVDCRIGEAESLPIETASVDYCLANMYLHHVERPAVAIGEMVRVLSPGGRIVLTDLDAHDHEFLRREHHDRWMGFEHESIRQWFRRAGLEDVHVRCLGETCRSTSTEGRAAQIGIFLASGRRASRVG